jgi:hypothetical protein
VREAAGDGARIVDEPCGVGIADGTGGTFCIAVSAVRKPGFSGVNFSSESEAFSKGEQLIEATGSRENERGRVQYNVFVGHAIGV